MPTRPATKPRTSTFSRARKPDGSLEPAAVEVSGLKTKNDGNNVDMDREARLLAENALRFAVATNLARSEIQTLRSAIEEGKTS